MRAAALVAALALTAAACGGDDGPDDDAAPTVTSSSTATTTEPTTTTTPEEAFLADLDKQISFDGTAGGPETALDLVRSACDLLDDATTEALLDDDAANDSPETDAAASRAITDLGLSAIYNETDDDEATAVILALGARHLCPQHRNAIIEHAATLGVTLPEGTG